jgi:hypothetical protein
MEMKRELPFAAFRVLRRRTPMCETLQWYQFKERNQDTVLGLKLGNIAMLMS